MTMFKDQPAFCSICGMKNTFPLPSGRPVLCSNECEEEFRWRNTLYINGKTYYRQPGCEEVFP